MAYQPSVGSTAAFQSGMVHNTNETGHSNAFTLGDDARSDQGLADTSSRWNARLLYSPAMNRATGGSQNDAAYQDMARVQGDYQPGQMPMMVDQIEQGRDDNAG